MSPKIITLKLSWAILLLTQCAHGFPSNPRQSRQNDDDGSSTSNPNVGFNVAQIIVGALTGNIDSIVKASFGFIEDPNVNKLSHNTWEHLKGNPTETPPWLTTSTIEPEEVSIDPNHIRSTQAPVVPPTAAPTAASPAAPAQVSAGQPLSPANVISGPYQVGQSFPTPEPIYNYLLYQSSVTDATSQTTQALWPTLAPPPPSVIFEDRRTTTDKDTDDEDPDDADAENSVKVKIRGEQVPQTTIPALQTQKV